MSKINSDEQGRIVDLKANDPAQYYVERRKRRTLRKQMRLHPHQVKIRIWRNSGGECHYCGAPATTVDHIVPKSKGGSDRWENLYLCCYECNNKKSDMSYEDFIALIGKKYD